MPLTIDAVFENGALRPLEPVTLAENERVRITIEPVDDWVRRSQGIIGWTGDAQTVEYFAMDKDLEYPPFDEP
jgi:predicted DNA-binding antitoxin AbrB/MazE fold protein